MEKSTAEVEINAPDFIISGAKKGAVDVEYQVYGVLSDGTRILLFNNGEEILNSYLGVENGGISYEGIAFTKYVVVFKNNTASSVRVNSTNFSLTVHERVYKVTVENKNGFTANIEYVNGSQYQSGERALDKNGVAYFYNDDSIRVIVNAPSANKKLSAGSHLNVGGTRVYPTYTHGAEYKFSYLNEFEYLIKKNPLNVIKIVNKDLNIVVEFKETDNVSGKNNINIGPLGAKLSVKNDQIKRIRFGVAWYLDDVVSANKWYRDKCYGAYIVLFDNLLKVDNNTNDFWAYLNSNNDKGHTIAKYNAASDAVKLEILSDFIDYWNANSESNVAIIANNGGTEKHMISFGEGIALNAVADFYYYRDGKNEADGFAVSGAMKAYIEFSAVLSFKNAPASALNSKLIYLPYSSYVYGHNGGFFVPEKEYPHNVYQFTAPTEIYTYNEVAAKYQG